MQRIAASIQEGAMAFLKAEYKVLAIFVVVVAGLLAWANSSGENQSPIIAVSFVIGAIASGLAGWVGMNVATKANVRTTAAAAKSLPAALRVAFNGGAVMGMSVVGLALIGLGGLYIFYTGHFDAFSGTGLTATVKAAGMKTTLNVLAGFSMGASSIALFARVGGGIYTKAADVGADLVGKVEQGLPEDSPNNPAVIADNVGDNVGDVAGLGADLFESYVGAIIGTMVLALGFIPLSGELTVVPVLLPLVIAACGIICSILGTFFVRAGDNADTTKIQHALDFGAFGAAFVMAAATFGIAKVMWPAAGLKTPAGLLVEWSDIGTATVIGLAIGVLVGMITSYYCSMGKKPVNSIAEQSN
jgi:K(+)-stimulated pyrophosphate-energized sodium pump